MQAALAPEPTGGTNQHHNLRAVLGRRGFRRLLAARLLSQLGDGWFQAGLAGSVFFNPEQAASPVAIAAAFAVLLVPYSALGPFVGVFLDRWNRRTSLTLVNVVRAVLVVPTAAFVWYGRESPAFVITALGVVACNRFFLAGLSASLPHVVEEARLVTANSFATTGGTVIYSVGLATAGGVFGVTGTAMHPYAVVSATAALAYGGAAALLHLAFRRRALGPEHPVTEPVLRALAQVVRGLVAGLRHLAQRPAAASLMAVQGIHRAFYGVLAITTLLLYRSYYASDDAGASLNGLLVVAAAGAVGSLLAALVTPALTRHMGGARWVTALMAMLAVTIPALGLQYLPTLTVAASLLVGLATQGTKIVTDTALQQQVYDDFRGRVFSVNDTLFNLLFVMGVVAGAFVLPPDGYLPVSMIVVGVGYAVLALWYGLSASRHAALVAAET